VTAGETAPGAFDDAADFARHDLVRYASSAARPYGSMPLWVDRGRRDWFVKGSAAFVGALEGRGARVTSRLWPGDHDGDYWRRHTGDYLRFYARELADCRR
jgi:enterochelin esterase-like enzyme